MADTESRRDDGAKCEVCGEPSAGRTIDDVELCAEHAPESRRDDGGRKTRRTGGECANA